MQCRVCAIEKTCSSGRLRESRRFRGTRAAAEAPTVPREGKFGSPLVHLWLFESLVKLTSPRTVSRSSAAVSNVQIVPEGSLVWLQLYSQATLSTM